MFEKIKRWVMKLLGRGDAQTAFDVEPIVSERMNDAIELWTRMEKGNPPWVDGDSIRSVKFSNTIARELASLIVLNVDVQIDGGENVDVLSKALDDDFLKNAGEILEKVVRLGGVMAKWNGEGIEYVGPDRFVPVETDTSGEITSAIFFSYYSKGRKRYTRAEWHRFEDDAYLISNRAFVSENDEVIGEPIPLTRTDWAELEPETRILGLEKPLFAYLKNPYSNVIDDSSPLGVSTFAECVEELRWLDIAMSTLGTEVEDSKPMLFVDAAALRTAKNVGIELPRFVQAVGDAVAMEKTTISQWTPKLQVESRKEGINFYLSIISYKCGFDPGYFVFNGQTISIATATQVEATERRTVKTVQTYRSVLDRPVRNGEGRCGFIHDLAYVIDAMNVATGKSRLSQFGNYEIYCDFADLTVNEEEDKAFDYRLSTTGYMAKWRFLVRHLGLTEEEAKQMVAEANEEKMAEAPTPFDEEDEE